jgi:hypothetical protein
VPSLLGTIALGLSLVALGFGHGPLSVHHHVSTLKLKRQECRAGNREESQAGPAAQRQTLPPATTGL